MKNADIILLLIIALITTEMCLAQKKPMHFPQLYREARRTSKIADPEKAIKELESILTSIPEKKNRKFVNLRFMLSLRLADLYVRTGAYAQAENLLLLLTSQVREQKPGPAKATLSFYGTMYDCFEKLGYFYLRTGNLRKTEILFTESESLRKAVFPVRSVHRIQPLVGFGSLYYLRGDEDKTYHAFNKAEELLTRATSTFYDYDNIGRIYLSDLSEICLAQGRYDEAWQYINQLSVASSGIGKFGSRISRNLEVSRIMELKARYHLLQQNYNKAQEYLDQALEYYSSRIGSSDVKFKLLKTQALLFWYQGNIDKSNDAFLALIRSYKEHISRNFVAMSEYEKEQFYNTLKNDFNLFNAYAIDNYASPGGHVLFEEMYNNALNTKALLLNETNKIKNAIIQSNDTDLIEKFHQWEALKSKLSSSYFDKNATDQASLLESKIENLEKEINNRSNLFASTENPPDWTKVKAALKSREAAIEIVRINTVNKKVRNNYGSNGGLTDSTVYLAMILQQDSQTPQCIFLPDGNQLEKRFLPYYRNSIIGRTGNNLTYDKFWAPLKKHLKDVYKIYLSPDGVYNQINLNTLQNPVTRQFLLDETDIIYLTNTGDLLKTRTQTKNDPVGVLFGRPAYDIKQVQTIKNQTTSLLYGTRNVLTDEMSDFRDQEFSDLPGTEVEINTIERALTSRQITVKTFKKAEALEENVKAVSSPAILHVATHGFFIGDSASLINPMIRSGLVMAGVRNQDARRTEDGILTAYEATNLNLDNTSLVVLSACDTGLGEIRNGEGVYGLQRAMIVAGADNLLMSLWKVDDEATALLMGEFYNHWSPGENQSAFRQAQMVLREKYPDPYYWGAFIMLGR